LEKLAVDCCKQSNWEQAEKFLLELWNNPTQPQNRGSRSQKRLRTMLTFAEVYFGKKDYVSAEKWCHEASREIKANVGMKDPLFYESIYLLTKIYKANEDSEEAEAYTTLLPIGYIGIIS
jgi:hypothetical protein